MCEKQVEHSAATHCYAERDWLRSIGFRVRTFNGRKFFCLKLGKANVSPPYLCLYFKSKTGHHLDVPPFLITQQCEGWQFIGQRRSITREQVQKLIDAFSA